MLKLTTDKYETSRGLSATADLLVTITITNSLQCCRKLTHIGDTALDRADSDL